MNQKKHGAIHPRKMKAHGFEDPCALGLFAGDGDLVDLVPHSALVYDCVDRHSAYGGLMDPALVDRWSWSWQERPT